MGNDLSIIQGGMGVAVSGWKLAKSVSELGQLGVVSGTGIDSVIVRRLQLGDEDGSIRRALSTFPSQKIRDRILNRYFIDPEKDKVQKFKHAPLLNVNLTKEHEELLVASNFVEVFLAKENHSGLVGINFLEKIKLAILPSLYGALLADVDFVLIGAGIPRSIPGILDQLAKHLPVYLTLDVVGAESGDNFETSFSPKSLDLDLGDAPLKRPKFLPIISSVALATNLLRRSNGEINGFVIESPTAGGHNAPPRGELQLNKNGEPIYSERDEVNLEAIRKLGKDFWLAGSYGTENGLRKAQELGAKGIQVGSLFALAQESGLDHELKQEMISKILSDELEVITDPKASPTNFPFKVARLPGTLSEEPLYQERQRQCDLGYLRELYKKDDGSVGYRCPSEDPKNYVKKGGKIENTVGRKCLCNALLANVGLPQTRKSELEKPLVTFGSDFQMIKQILHQSNKPYRAKDVIDALLKEAVA